MSSEPQSQLTNRNMRIITPRPTYLLEQIHTRPLCHEPTVHHKKQQRTDPPSSGAKFRDHNPIKWGQNMRSHPDADFYSWLQTVFDVQRTTTDLHRSGTLKSEDFLALVQTESGTGNLKPSDIAELRQEHDKLADRVETRATERSTLEHALAAAVDGAYGLSSEQRDLVRTTAPPRTPLYTD